MSVAAPEFTPEFIDVDGTKIAVRYRAGDKLPGVVWLGGYRSDMLGTKAVILDEWAAQTGHSALRHDYSGHGESGGDFNQGTISRWLAQSLAVYRHYASGPQILVGSLHGRLDRAAHGAGTEERRQSARRHRADCARSRFHCRTCRTRAYRETEARP